MPAMLVGRSTAFDRVPTNSACCLCRWLPAYEMSLFSFRILLSSEEVNWRFHWDNESNADGGTSLRQGCLLRSSHAASFELYSWYGLYIVTFRKFIYFRKHRKAPVASRICDTWNDLVNSIILQLWISTPNLNPSFYGYLWRTDIRKVRKTTSQFQIWFH